MGLASFCGLVLVALDCCSVVDVMVSCLADDRCIDEKSRSWRRIPIIGFDDNESNIGGKSQPNARAAFKDLSVPVPLSA